MFRVILHRDAEKAFRRAVPDLQNRIAEAIATIAVDPFRHSHIKKLKGPLSHLHRYRIGDLRIIYEVHLEENLVRVVAIAHRGSAYR